MPSICDNHCCFLPSLIHDFQCVDKLFFYVVITVKCFLAQEETRATDWELSCIIRWR